MDSGVGFWEWTLTNEHGLCEAQGQIKEGFGDTRAPFFLKVSRLEHSVLGWTEIPLGPWAKAIFAAIWAIFELA